MTEQLDGDYVEFKDVQHLQDLNAQMLEALKAFVGIESDARLMQARYGIEIRDDAIRAFKLMNAAIAAAEGRAEV
ncbi:MAG: hypothetical protein FGM22_07445 [Burkholderiaceae bacterium]|nr:hypothetical protein [Burkholderiaceae bacterium]